MDHHNERSLKKKSEKLELPSISMRKSNISTCEVKRKKSIAQCKIMIPKNCPFPFSNKIKRGRTERTEKVADPLDFLGLDLDISRISEASNQTQDDQDLT